LSGKTSDDDDEKERKEQQVDDLVINSITQTQLRPVALELPLVPIQSIRIMTICTGQKTSKWGYSVVVDCTLPLATMTMMPTRTAAFTAPARPFSLFRFKTMDGTGKGKIGKPGSLLPILEHRSHTQNSKRRHLQGKKKRPVRNRAATLPFLLISRRGCRPQQIVMALLHPHHRRTR
jgi:hypothetical protein